MTDEEANALNTEVAAAMGWRPTCNPCTGLTRSDTPFYFPNGKDKACEVIRSPDFCRDVRDIGYLLEWASKQENFGVYLDNDSKDHAKPWGCNMGDTRSPHRSFCGAGDTAGEAFCRAILAYTEISK